MEKKTFVVDIGKESYLIAIMRHMKWKEINRVESGGYMSTNHLMITFQGMTSDYQEDLYVEVPDRNSVNGFIYYSILYPEGYYLNGSNPNHFKEMHDQRKTPDLEVKQFNS